MIRIDASSLEMIAAKLRAVEHEFEKPLDDRNLGRAWGMVTTARYDIELLRDVVRIEEGSDGE